MEEKPGIKFSSKLEFSNKRLFIIVVLAIGLFYFYHLAMLPTIDWLQTRFESKDESQASFELPITRDNPLQIITTTLALTDFTERIGGDYVQVRNILPPGVDAHDYEPTTRQILEIAQAHALIYNGADFESWIEKILAAISGDSQGVFVNASEKLALLGRETGHPDPHVWLDPHLALGQAEQIRDLLLSLDPDNRDIYLANYTSLADDLEELDASYQRELASFDKRSFIVSHGAYNYLAARYDLEAIAITGIHPGVEPSQQELRGLIDMIVAGQHAYIFFEPTVSNKIAELVAEASQAEILYLHPLENFTLADLEAGATYISLMEENLVNLKKGLDGSD